MLLHADPAIDYRGDGPCPCSMQTSCSDQRLIDAKEFDVLANR